MEAPLKDCTTLEQRAVIRFLNAEGIQTSQICQRMKNIYGESCLSQKNIYKWVNGFKNGRITCSSGLNIQPQLSGKKTPPPKGHFDSAIRCCPLQGDDKEQKESQKVSAVAGRKPKLKLQV
ncbi:hypothetical protein LAZ67_4003627 [Cordylochernes scorpioides]|uniref:Mos1 transposase HTH domain-containing protein n=1 Tax=Cordylochernes scorpioides TaxID=51811 RepID=A0ABY6KDS5_9ARAC|nr:hypothetical protein LAZ67_4003627 [Cordylochernes scorpioides]